jgi:cytochrome c oxidase cbb3-type subunit 1
MAEPPPILPAERPFVVGKARVEAAAENDTAWTRLIYVSLAYATLWLIIGTLIGVYLSIKFTAPDVDHVPWLSFGRLRPVHTNTVFWGWTSQAMIALALYVVPKTSQRRLHSFALAWTSLALTNLAVIIGGLCLMAGINNGGQEYREYVWPVMALFAAGVVLTAYNLIRTIAGRGIEEIYISNWYIMGGFLWTSVLLTIAYVPFYQQNGT